MKDSMPNLPFELGLSRARSLSFSKSGDTKVESPDNLPECIDPGFFLLQIFPYPILEEHYTPLIVPNNDICNRALSVLDRTPSIDLHKIGVVYVDRGQTTESQILSNTQGTRHYAQFLQTLGNMFDLVNNTEIYTGGLDTSPDCLDGRYAICFVPDQRLSQVIFHVTTLMPNMPHDQLRTAKKRHIGNDFVTIVWNESGFEYDPQTIPGQFNLVQIVITPMSGLEFSNRAFLVQVMHHADLSLSFLPITISGHSLGSFVRQISIFCNMLAQVHSSGETSSNSKERLRQIKRLKSRLEAQISNLDFTNVIQ